MILRKIYFVNLVYCLCLNVHAVQLLSDEYGAMTPGSLEAQGLISASEYQKVTALTRSASPDAHKKIAGEIKNAHSRAVSYSCCSSIHSPFM